jgi:hypothetical protein
MTNKVVDAYLIYQFLKRLTTPFEDTEAFKLGIIDEKGKVLKKRSTLTPQEAQEWGYFDVMVNNMKKLLAKVPGGRSKMGLYAASALLFKEHKNLENKSDEDIEKYFSEEIANIVGGEKIAGVGIGSQGEPGVKKKRKKDVIPFNMFKRKMLGEK